MSDPIDLCIVDDVKAQIVTQTNSRDLAIQDLITTASQVILDWTGRELAPATTAPATRTFQARSRRVLMLPAGNDLRSATTVRIDTDTASPQTLVAGTDYSLQPVYSPWGVYSWLEIPTLTFSGDAGRVVEIAGQWGFATIPHAAKQACITTVRAWLTRTAGIAFEDDTPMAPQPGPPNIYWLPASARHLLAPLRRRPLAG